MECFRFFFAPLPSSSSDLTEADAAAGVGDELVGDLPMPSANNAATASPSSEDFSGVGAGEDFAAGVVLVGADFSFGGGAGAGAAVESFGGVGVDVVFGTLGAVALEAGAGPGRGEGVLVAAAAARRALSAPGAVA